MKKMDASSPLILQKTAREDIEKGVTVLTKGEGVYIYDQDGKQYMDLTSGFTRPVHIGYGRKEIAQAIYDQICDFHYFTPMEYANLPAMELAEVLVGITPEKIDRFAFICDGSEAVETAIKLARHYHEYRGDKKRYKVISRRGAYHGATGGALRVLGTVLPMRHIMEPLSPGTLFVESPYCYRCPLHLHYPDCDIACARDVERTIEFEDPEQISALIAEPIQQGFGVLTPVKEYWGIIREICDTYGICLIVDEVICGFGRTGKWFGIQHYGIEPDIITMAKGISSGYVPLGAVGCREKIIAPVEIFNQLHTYGNHPVACAAGLKNIEIIRDEGLVERAAKVGQYFIEALASLSSHAIVGEVRGKGLWTAIDLTTDKRTRAPFPVKGLLSLVAMAKEKGVIIRSMNSSLEFAPPLTIQTEEIDKGIRILDECLSEGEKDMGL